MQLSKILLKTLRENPQDAEVESHRLLVRAGYIQKLASGIHTFLPLGLKILNNISDIIRLELDKDDVQEILMPVLQPVDIWEESGRSKHFGNELPAFLVEGRGGNFVLGPTHEEVVTKTVSQIAESFRNLPVSVFQIQTKFRDEARPRYGLLRTRELIMADAYSFDSSKSSMIETYSKINGTYARIFEKLNLNAVAVEAVSGAIGGDVNHEYMVPSPIGEDTFVKCQNCGYSANVEAAVHNGYGTKEEHSVDKNLEQVAKLEEVFTPGNGSIEEVSAQLGMDKSQLILAIAYTTEAGQIQIGLIPGDRHFRLQPGCTLLSDDDFAREKPLVKGFLGPIGKIDLGYKVIADLTLKQNRHHGFVIGADKENYHFAGALIGRDFEVSAFDSISVAQDGDMCQKCGQNLELIRAVEVAHTFQLGHKYSGVMSGATFLGQDGKLTPYYMGCYGIGVSRLVSVIAESFHDEKGLKWPLSVAPYSIHIVPLHMKKNKEVQDRIEDIVTLLASKNISFILDDRDLSPGVSFKDAELLGMPFILTVGGRSLERGVIELKNRHTNEITDIDFNNLEIIANKVLV